MYHTNKLPATEGNIKSNKTNQIMLIHQSSSVKWDQLFSHYLLFSKGGGHTNLTRLVPTYQMQSEPNSFSVFYYLFDFCMWALSNSQTETRSPSVLNLSLLLVQLVLGAYPAWCYTPGRACSVHSLDCLWKSVSIKKGKRSTYRITGSKLIVFVDDHQCLEHHFPKLVFL